MVNFIMVGCRCDFSVEFGIILFQVKNSVADIWKHEIHSHIVDYMEREIYLKNPQLFLGIWCRCFKVTILPVFTSSCKSCISI